jgi:hypothetical protein
MNEEMTMSTRLTPCSAALLLALCASAANVAAMPDLENLPPRVAAPGSATPEYFEASDDCRYWPDEAIEHPWSDPCAGGRPQAAPEPSAAPARCPPFFSDDATDCGIGPEELGPWAALTLGATTLSDADPD